MKKIVLVSAMTAFALSASAQQLQEGYITWGTSSDKFDQTLNAWSVGSQVSEDDNFFISRVKPRERFRNTATQVRLGLTEANDKKLLAWIPVNNSFGNALPDGVFDSEVFTMWPYVTHWGNWTAPLGRVPGAFLDVAHKNGVPVSGVAGIPYGSLTTNGWGTILTNIAAVGAEKVAQYHTYYGVDGMGYNSEFSGGYAVQQKLFPFHAALVKKMRETNPLFENIWYDGTNDNGTIMFDRGLASHNEKTFGDGDNIRTSLFFNYNWNSASLLSSSVTKAQSINRDPLDLYAGVNMQGAEPRSNSWPLLADYAISIGLWGAHSENMFWESRGEKGSAPDVKQRTYMLRTERWFTGGTRNPANCPAVTSSMKYNADNFTFHGMSSFMTARSSMKWNLSEEPFISYFNLGNGKFFNWQGVQQNDRPWYNVGVQDYLPTWRWWFASKLLGRNASDVPASGLDAEFVWDNAYVGGSCLRIFGTAADEYLHLFKTEYALQSGDVITVRYKLNSGKAGMNLVLTALGNESVAINESGMNLLAASDEADEDAWVERQFTVGGELAGKTVALVALHFTGAENLDLNLGEFSIVRGTSVTPASPVIASSKVLAFSKEGVDGKIIFNMPNSKPAGTPCYNLDVNTAFFKLYAQQEGCDPVFMGLTTSWAGLYYNIPLDFSKGTGSIKVRFGVAAVALDHKSDSQIAWGEYHNAGTYIYSDDIQISKNTIKPNESFEMSYVDPNHEPGTWQLFDGNGAKLFEETGVSVTVNGLANIGSYTLKLNGNVYNSAGNRETQLREYGSFVQITGEGVGALPQILSLTANGKEADIEVKADDEIALAYTGRKADGAGSQGVNLNEKRFGAKCADLGLVGAKSFSVSFWLKINKLAEGETQLLAVANKVDSWPKTDWGWIWNNLASDGSIGCYTFRGTDASSNNELQYTYGNTKIPVGNWVHLAYTFDYNTSGAFRSDFYVNGVKQTVTSWKRATTGASTTSPGYEKNVYNITDGQVVSVGGDAHGRSGIDGVIDNFTIWNGVLTDAEVKASMGDLNKAALPSNVISYWDLEDAAAADYTFASAGSKAGVKAGMHEYAATGSEGQGAFGWIEAEPTSGCPFVIGTAFPVVTQPTWKAKKGTLTPLTGNDQSGSAKVTYAKGGDYTVTLTLANSLGSDQRTFQVIKVAGGESGIAKNEIGSMRTYTVGEDVIIDFAEAGNYSVRVFNAEGREVAAKAAQMTGNGKMQLRLGATGTYIVQIKKDGKNLRAVKLLKK